LSCPTREDNNLRILTLLLLTVSLLSAQYEGPIPEPTSGYGALGPNDIMHLDIPNPNFFIKDISIFYPSETSGPVPTICFLHGFGANDTTTYIETLRHIASWGYATVFVPYKTINSTIPQRYQTLYEGFLEAAQQLPMIIDTSRIGLYGHSFGGGAIPATAYKLFVHNNWGVNGKFVFCNAP